MTFDIDQFEERAGVLEFDEGMTRFAAETEAARRQGLKRWEVFNAIRNRNLATTSDRRAAAGR
ncbi:MAG: hypothetical protein AAFQ05_02855 [Pseudomonadota bacterium]